MSAETLQVFLTMGGAIGVVFGALMTIMYNRLKEKDARIGDLETDNDKLERENRRFLALMIATFGDEARAKQELARYLRGKGLADDETF